MADRRDLTFTQLDDVMPDVMRLLAGHEVVGHWTLGQICHHLNVATTLTLLDDPATDAEPDAHPSFERRRQRFFQAGRFPEGVVAPHPSLLPPEGLDDRAEAESLRGALTRFAAHSGTYRPHPMLGPLSRAEWERFHCMHAAHHLGFAVPV